MEDGYKIAAVVVTFNRLELLKKCIESIRNQTRSLDEIIVVNNSSSDGSLEWLMQQSDLTVITQENSGSAGGQHTGIKTAYEKGFDWIWCMDDDGMADKNCLMHLLDCLRINKELLVIGSLVREKPGNVLSFPISIEIGGGKYIESHDINVFENYLEDNLFLNGYAAFFLGVLINKHIVQFVGLPIREFFGWGEEIEYFLRIKFAGMKIATSFNSFFYHPRNNWEFKKWILGRSVYKGALNWKSLNYFRNRAIIASKYNRFYDIKFFLSQLSYFLLQLRFFNCIQFINSYIKGIKLNILKDV